MLIPRRRQLPALHPRRLGLRCRASGARGTNGSLLNGGVPWISLSESSREQDGSGKSATISGDSGVPDRRHALSQTAKSPNRFNPTLPSMTFRVQMNRLKPGMESVDALDIAEGLESPISQFTTEQSP
jgi:hypothetical protein